MTSDKVSSKETPNANVVAPPRFIKPKTESLVGSNEIRESLIKYLQGEDQQSEHGKKSNRHSAHRLYFFTGAQVILLFAAYKLGGIFEFIFIQLLLFFWLFKPRI